MPQHVPLPRLRAFRKGQIDSDDELERIAQHLAECPDCQREHAAIPEAAVVQWMRSAELPTREVAAAETEVEPGENKYWPLPDDLKILEEHWDVQEFLGAGGMGAVYQARRRDQPEAGAVAIKVIQLDLTSRSASVKRLQRELQLINDVEPHPNLVCRYQGRAVGPFFVIELEFVPGLDLERFAQREEQAGQRLPIAQACGFTVQALAGLDHAWRTKQLVHRDLKPRNLIKTPDGTIRIIDFGLAKVMGDGTDPGVTTTGSKGGSPHYCAPEQAHDFKRADIRSDLYSLGCTLYRLLAGQPPFCERTGHSKDWQVQHAHDSLEPDSLERLRREVPEGLSLVVHKLLAKNPADRYQTPAAAVAALVPFLDAEDREQTLAWLPPETVTNTKKSRPRRGLVAVAAVLLLLVVLGIVLQLQTKAGTVEVEITAPQAEIRIDDRPVDRTRIKIRSAGPKQWLVIEATRGEHLVKVTAPGFDVFSESVTVRAGTATPVRVTLKPLPATEKLVLAKGSEPAESVGTPKAEPEPARPDWVSLFNGSDLAGWEQDNNEGTAGEWKVVEGELDGSDTNRGLRTLRTDYADFHLRMDVKLSLNANSGVYVRVSDGEPTRHYECELWLPRDPKWYTIGTIHRIPGPPLPPNFGPIVHGSEVRPDTWFKHEVVVRDAAFEILVDGKTVSKWTDPDPLAQKGALRFRTFLRIPEQTIRFRNIEIMEFPKKAE